jgi:thiamine biosynthesis lipoprotein
MKQATYTQDRRAFLKTLGILAAGAAVAPAVQVLPAFAAAGMSRMTEQRMLMGTFVSMTVLTPSRQLGEEAMGRAFAEIERQVGIFSRFDSTTALSALNSHGRLASAPKELVDVVSFSGELFRRSSGRFDATIAPVVNLLERSGGKPDAVDMKEALALVDGSRLRCSGSTLSFAASGMAATLDGVAKGYIADSAADALVGAGVVHFLIDAGGDIRVGGSADGLSRPWRVAIEDPDKQGNYPAVIDLTSGAVATSGGYEVFYDQAKKSNHLVNPETGASPQYVRSVSVKAPTVREADGLATALSIMHPREALRLTDSLPGHSCLLVTSTGARIPSSHWG